MTTRKLPLCIALIVAVSFVATGGVLRNGFTGWDDPHTIVENTSIRDPNAAGIARYWNPRNHTAGLFVPLTYTVWGALAAISNLAWGALKAWPFHLASLSCHVTSSIVVFLIVRRITSHDWAACAGAMIFAAHPIQVEAVAWASGLKDVLAGMLALVGLHQRMMSIDPNPTCSPGRRLLHANAAVAAFAGAMLAKPSAACAIPIAVILDLLILRPPARLSIATLAPWAAIAVPLLWLARTAQETAGIPWIPWLNRPLIPGDALAFYLFKLVAPVNLSIDYGRTPAVAIESGAAWVTWLAPAAIAIVLGVTRSRVLIASALVFVAGLSMNLGLVPFQFQFYSTVADHYVYLSMFGVALATAALAALVSPRPDGARLASVFIALIVLTLTILAFRQTRVWRDSISLFTHAVSVNPQSAGSRNNLGRALGEAGFLDEAAAQFRAVLELAPYDPLAHRNLALVCVRRDDIRGAIAHLGEAIRLLERAGENTENDRRELARLRALLETRGAPE
jgi:tetratricopeptide (TPR) repeat protein